MYERFTDRARKVLQLSHQEAKRLNHEYIGTEHVLLGLVGEGNGVAAHVLKNLDIDLPTLRKGIERLVRPGTEKVNLNKLLQTPRAKKALELAMEEAQHLDHNYVGTEHILLGLLREDVGVAAQVLLNLGLKLHEVRQEVLSLLGQDKPECDPPLHAHAEKRLRRLFEPSQPESLGVLPATGALIAVDIGNSRMKLGRFVRKAKGDRTTAQVSEAKFGESLPQPDIVFDLAIENQTGAFDIERLNAWCCQHVGQESAWAVASVHRAAADRLTAAVASWGKRLEVECTVRWLTRRDLPLEVRVDAPERVGIDRLLGALAASQLREPGRAAIVVDLGSAITVDLLDADGAFTGGAILPGIGMSARALAEQTDALPHVSPSEIEQPPAALGKSTTQAIQAGLYWGAAGAIRELIGQLSAGLAQTPEVFVTGGASAQLAELLGKDRPVRHVPNLVLSGIALVSDA
jgi:type III pantothenate kinase